jgi:hypothetical protein
MQIVFLLVKYAITAVECWIWIKCLALLRKHMFWLLCIRVAGKHIDKKTLYANSISGLLRRVVLDDVPSIFRVEVYSRSKPLG